MVEPYDEMGSAGFAYDVFLSYSNKDLLAAREILTRMQARGLKVWFAPNDLGIGRRFIPEIEAALLASQVLVCLLSTASVTAYWVAYEIEAQHNLMSKDRRHKLIPVLLPGLKDQEIPPFLRAIHYCDARDLDLNRPGETFGPVEGLILSIEKILAETGGRRKPTAISGGF